MSKLSAILSNKCPRCGEGNIFKNKSVFPLLECTKMNEECDHCQQATELEVGFYYGTGYLSYGLVIAITVATFVMFKVLHGFSLDDNSIFIWLSLNFAFIILIQPWMMRFSRTLYLSFFVKYQPKE